MVDTHTENVGLGGLYTLMEMHLTTPAAWNLSAFIIITHGELVHLHRRSLWSSNLSL